jgi:hypothetical protein
MLSSMITQLGLMVIGPGGEAVRIQRGHPAFAACCALVGEPLPAEQRWAGLKELMGNPLKALIDWCARFGVLLVDGDEGDILRLQDRELRRCTWLPLLNRSYATGGSPIPVLLLAEKLGAVNSAAKVGDACLHLGHSADGSPRFLGLVKTRQLPAASRAGDLVDRNSTGDTPFLVSYETFNMDVQAGDLVMGEGRVLGPVPGAAEILADVLAQPVILGHDHTYRCEEGSPDGWLAARSSDSLKEAITHAREIRTFGSDVRIINRISGEPVAWEH